MQPTRTQLLWIFQLYLDRINIYDEDRREKMSGLFLDGTLSPSTMQQFKHWRRTNKVSWSRPRMLTRGSRLWWFQQWLRETDRATPEIRERFTRLYLANNLARPLRVHFHRWLALRYRPSTIGDTHELPHV